MEYNLFRQDYEIIKRLLIQGKLIKKLYNSLSIYEVFGLKNSDLFNDDLKSLKEAIRFENELYKELKLDYHKILMLTVYLEQMLKDKTKKDDYDGINRIILAISNKSFDFDKNINFAFHNDYFRGMYLFLNEYINDPKFSKQREIFIREIKYLTSYFYKSVENDMLQNKFDIPDSLYLSSKFMADFLHFDQKEYENIKETFALDMFSLVAKEILKNNNDYYSNDVGSIFAILKECFLRSSLLNIDEDIIEEIKNDIKSFGPVTDDNTISVGIINGALNKSLEDKKKTMLVSFCRKK